jgi:hypothetical protein
MDKRMESISCLLKEWKDIKNQLEALFRERKQQNIKPLMDQGISLFIQFLSMSNGYPELVDKPFIPNQYEFKPVNVEERLGFIMSRPALFHSYRQLSELMVEQEKLFMRRSILKKASKPNG